MKKLIVLLGLLGSFHANAGPYSDMTNVTTTCDQYGQIGANVFALRELPGFKPETPPADMPKDQVELYTYAADYGMKGALNEQDAYIKPWAKCMDKYAVKKAKRK